MAGQRDGVPARGRLLEDRGEFGGSGGREHPYKVNAPDTLWMLLPSPSTGSDVQSANPGRANGSPRKCTNGLRPDVSVLDLVKLTPLLGISTGKPRIMLGLVDGPVAMNHPDLAGGSIRELKVTGGSPCTRVNSTACLHGTFVAGILCARRTSVAPAICPGCTLLVRPIFPETPSGDGRIPSAKPQELATAIIECVEAGARVINLSLALAQPSTKGERALEDALDYAAQRGVIVVAAAGNQGLLGSTAITRHPWVIPVVACDLRGKPMGLSNLGRSIGQRGLAAPGERITSLGAAGQPLTLGGTSAATPFVTGAIGLLWSEFPNASAASIKLAVTRADSHHRITVVPALLNAWRAHQYLLTTTRRKLA